MKLAVWGLRAARWRCPRAASLSQVRCFMARGERPSMAWGESRDRELGGQNKREFYITRRGRPNTE